MRIAVLSDVHGNLPALRAVLAELDAVQPDVIVSAGDVTGGAMVRECLDLLAGRPEPVHWVKGNGERETVKAYDDPGGPVSPMAAWGARSLDAAWRNRLDVLPIALSVDGVCVCHGSPRSEDEILTRVTPDAVFAQALADTPEPLTVGGHTHQQFIRTLDDTTMFVNAGSVGYPYEGRPAAFWLLIEHGVPNLRSTAYDLEAALSELRASGYPQLDADVDDALVDPADPEWVAEYFEHVAHRGPDPGLERRVQSR